MLREVKAMLWRASAVSLGAALPLVLVGRMVMTVLLALGIILGVLATKGESIRATVRLLLDSWLVLLILAFLGAMLASSSLGVVPAVSFDKWLQIDGIILASGFLFFVLREMPGAYVDKMMKALAVATYAMAALAVLDALTGYERLAIALHDADKISSAYRLNFFSSVLVVVLPLVWSRLLVKAREFEPFAVRILWPAVGFGMFALVVSGGRAGWVAAAISFTMFWFLVARFHQVVLHARHWLGAALWGVLAFVGYGFANGWQFMMARVGLVEEGGRGALSGRLDIWTQVITWIPENWLMGIGPMGYRYVPGALDAHPHSWLLQMLLEVGVVGTLLFTAVAGVVWLRLWALSRAGIYGVGALCSLTAFLIAGLANTSIFNAWWLAFLPVISLIGWRVAWAPKDGRRKGRSSRVLKRSSLLSGGHGA